MNSSSIDPQVEYEQNEQSESRLQMACEVFGGGALPELQTAIYKVLYNKIMCDISSKV